MENPTNPVGDIMKRLSSYMATVSSTALAEDVVEKTKHHILDTMAAMISGSRLKPGRLAIDYVREEGGTPQALIPGTDVKTSAVNAALAGGICAHADETDDSHPRSFCHPGCAVVPAALAMAMRENSSGTEMLRAVTFGYDMAARIGLALDPLRFYGEHHRSTHSFGALFGAAGAAGVLAGLNADQCRWLISYTTQQASGIATWARDEEHIEKAFDFGGMGARNGVAGATMVAAGFTGVEDVFSGPRNFFEALGGNAEEMSLDLGTRFEIMDTHIKKWSIGSPVQAPLAALEYLMGKHHFGPDDIATIEAHVPAMEADITDNRAMPDICLQYLFAVMVIDGRVGFENSHDYARMDAPDVMALRSRIQIIPAKDLPRREGRTVVLTKDGQRMEHHVPHVRGTTINPMDRSEVMDKALDLINPILGDTKAGALANKIMTLETCPDISDLGPLMTET
jgi:2-methylcitrate dehydratase PrpD